MLNTMCIICTSRLRAPCELRLVLHVEMFLNDAHTIYKAKCQCTKHGYRTVDSRRGCACRCPKQVRSCADASQARQLASYYHQHPRHACVIPSPLPRLPPNHVPPALNPTPPPRCRARLHLPSASPTPDLPLTITITAVVHDMCRPFPSAVLLVPSMSPPAALLISTPTRYWSPAPRSHLSISPLPPSFRYFLQQRPYPLLSRYY